MVSRRLLLSLTLSFYLMGSVPSLLAMREDDTEVLDRQAKLPPSPLSAISQLELFKQIAAVTNPPLKSNEDFDRFQDALNSPIKWKVNFFRYCDWKSSGISEDKGEEDGSYVISIAILENNLKVLIKETLDRHEAIMESVVPQMARKYFDTPVVPPARLVVISEDKLELHQFYIDNNRAELEGSEEDLDESEIKALEKREEKEEKALWRTITRHPERYGRPQGFIDDLTAFEDFILANDRNSSNYLWSCEGAASSFFFAIDFEDTYYSFKKKKIKKAPPLHHIPLLSRRSIEILETLKEEYEGYFEKVKKHSPTHFDDSYFRAMKEWQENVLIRQRKYAGYPGIRKARNWQLHLFFKKNKRS